MDKRPGDFGLVFWVHLAFILFFFVSPFLVSWKIILLIILLFYLQLRVFGGCVLTQKQFGKGPGANTSFYHYYLVKLGCNVEKRKVNRFVNLCLVWIIFGIAFVWQIMLDKTPAFH